MPIALPGGTTRVPGGRGTTPMQLGYYVTRQHINPPQLGGLFDSWKGGDDNVDHDGLCLLHNNESHRLDDVFLSFQALAPQ